MSQIALLTKFAVLFFNEFEETFIHFDDLTREYKNKIRDELFSQMSKLNDNEFNTLTNKMIDFLNHLIRYSNLDPLIFPAAYILSSTSTVSGKKSN